MKHIIFKDLEEERKRNLEDTIRQAKWNAFMVKKLGTKWFEIRDKWLQDSFEKDKEMWKDPKIREALLKIFSKPTKDP